MTNTPEATPTEQAKDWRSFIERRGSMLAADLNILERQFIAAITEAEARGEARGRAQALEEAAALIDEERAGISSTDSVWVGFSSVLKHIANRLRFAAIESRTGESE